MTVTRYPTMQSRRDIGLRFLRLTLAAQRALPEPVPASLRGPPHVRHAEAHRAGDALPRLSRAGQLVPEPARLCDPASRASRVQRHRPRSTHPVAALERVVDDVEDEEAILRLRPRPGTTRAAVRRWVPGL